MENGKKEINAQADLPKKHAAPAEAPKSLAATVQQVMTKAITSPTDAKPDFAQGVKPVSGDAQQKSAGAADAMKSLQAQADAEIKKETSYESEDKEKKHEGKEEVKETEAETKDKEDVKKEEKEEKKEELSPAQKKLPDALQKAIAKKDESADEKKDVKEEEEKEKKEEDEKKKEVSESEEDKEKKEEDEKKKDEIKEEDEKKVIQAAKEYMKDSSCSYKEAAEKYGCSESEVKKQVESMEKEVAEAEEKEVKKETAQDKVKDMDMKEDVAALTDGEDLSEEFKQKAATIFESAVKAKLVDEIEKLEADYDKKVEKKKDEVKEEIVDKVDAYLNYVVESWMKDNELAIEKGLRNEITEEFIGGLKNLFETHYINVPQEKYDVLENQSVEINSLKDKLNESIEKNIELSQKINDFAREDIIGDIASDLAETESEKLKGLAESIEYKDAASFRKSVETLKNSYYPKAKAKDTESNVVAENNQTVDLSESMAAYTAAISKQRKNPYDK
jgi:hypothetical protein